MAKDECSRSVREVAVLARGAMAENKIVIDPQALKILEDIEDIHIYDRSKEEKKSKTPSLGVIHLDRFTHSLPGDMDSPDSFAYPVFYRVVPGLTHDMCKSGTLPPQVAASFAEAIRWLDEEKDVQGISGDCGFMIWF